MSALKTIYCAVILALLVFVAVGVATQSDPPLEPWLVDTGNPFLQCYIFPETHPMRLSPSDYPHEQAINRSTR